MASQKEINQHIPLNSKNSTRSIAKLFEARKFFTDKSIPFITDVYLDSKIEETSTIRIVGESDTESLGVKRNFPFANIYNENAMFGVVDLEGDIIAPINNPSFFKAVNFANNKNIYMLDFIADAFNDMKNYLNQATLKNLLSNQSAYYNPNAKKGYQNIDNLYISNYLFELENFKRQALADKHLDSKIIDFKSFVKEYTKYLKKVCLTNPVIKSKIVPYYNFTFFTSGLGTSFSDEDPGDDIAKYIDYYLDEGFLCFSQACVRFGFKHDKNLPFIIIADLKSPAMEPYYKKYGIQNVEDIFKKRFKKMYLEDLSALKYNFLNSYNTFLIDNELYEESINNICAKDSSKVEFKERPLANEQTLKSIPDIFWLKLYVYFKNLECGSVLTQIQFDNLIKLAYEYMRLNKEDQAMKIINSKFNEISGVFFYDSLLSKKDVVQQEDAAVGHVLKPEIIIWG